MLLVMTILSFLLCSVRKFNTLVIRIIARRLLKIVKGNNLIIYCKTYRGSYNFATWQI